MPAKILPDSMKNKLGIVSENDVSAVFDISGFAYSDQWGSQYAQIMADRSSARKNKGEKYYLLPQAYGPFENSKVSSVARAYFENAEVIYVRDKISLQYMGELMGEDDRIQWTPDFTCLVEPIQSEKPVEEDYVCIVPNCRMLDERHGGQGEKYVAGLVEAIEMLNDKGLHAVIVNHEGDEDLAIVKELQKRAGCETTIIMGGDARYLKGIFSKAKFVIASRFHALVSALTQGVPVIGTGWSHKYEELFSDFGVSENLIKLNDINSELLVRINDFMSDDYFESMESNINNGAKEYKHLATEMWVNLKGLV